jgi:hypothetical protein
VSIAKAESSHIVIIGVKLFFARLFLPQEKYNKFLSHEAVKIDRNALPYYSGLLVDCIKLTKKKSANFRNANSEADVIIALYPVFRPFYRDVYVVVSLHRKKCGLIV